MGFGSGAPGQDPNGEKVGVRGEGVSVPPSEEDRRDGEVGRCARLQRVGHDEERVVSEEAPLPMATQRSQGREEEGGGGKEGGQEEGQRKVDTVTVRLMLMISMFVVTLMTLSDVTLTE